MVCFQLEKYDIQPMSFNVEMDVTFFRSFSGSANVMVVPASCDEATPIVVRSPSLLTVLPGLYLVLARSRMETDLLRTYELERMVVNLYPSQIRPQSRRRLC
ncbi:hypothetical protein CPB85DRAFT_1342520 [Mucidula mucida]|nr:hypothetical protein CPB85DRAFT_1342520 [Mucidula mucida]